MAETSPVVNAEQIKQDALKKVADTQAANKVALQSADKSAAQASKTPPPAPPKLPTLPIQSPAKPGGPVKKKGIDITMNKISLFSLALSLIFFGALTFLGGFVIGVWFESPPKTQTPYIPIAQMPFTGQPHQQMYSQQQAYPQQQDMYHGGQSYVASNMPSSYPSHAGHAVEAGVTSMSVPHVPSALSPLVQATQNAFGKDLGHKLQHELSQVRHPSTSAPTPMHTAPSHGQSSPIHPGPTSQQMKSSSGHSSAGHSSAGHSSAGHQAQGPSLGSSSHKNAGDYKVQLGVYASPENATSLVRHLQNLNLTSSVHEVKSKNGSPLYYVYSGNYSDYSLALKSAARFATYDIPGAIVVKSQSSEKGNQ